MYEVVFELMQVSLPFTDFQISIFKHLRIARLFYNVFGISNSKKDGLFGLIHFVQEEKFFEE
jgi:hypothetical protein